MSDGQRRVLLLQAAEAAEWAQVGDHQIFVRDVVDAATEPDARMTVGFSRLAKGESLEISFPYDEVLVVTKGGYTVRTSDGETLTAKAGDVIYLPAGASNFSDAGEDTEIVYVAAPPSVYADHVAQATEAGEHRPTAT